MLTYYDTDKLPGDFSTYTLMAIGESNWDFFVHPTIKFHTGKSWVFCVAKREGCKSSSYGDIAYFNQMYTLCPQWFTALVV